MPPPTLGCSLPQTAPPASDRVGRNPPANHPQVTPWALSSVPMLGAAPKLISAAGKALLSGGKVAVRLTGRLVVRLKGGDLVVPLNLSGHLTDAS